MQIAKVHFKTFCAIHLCSRIRTRYFNGVPLTDGLLFTNRFQQRLIADIIAARSTHRMSSRLLRSNESRYIVIIHDNVRNNSILYGRPRTSSRVLYHSPLITFSQRVLLSRRPSDVFVLFTVDARRLHYMLHCSPTAAVPDVMHDIVSTQPNSTVIRCTRHLIENHDDFTCNVIMSMSNARYNILERRFAQRRKVTICF